MHPSFGLGGLGAAAAGLLDDPARVAEMDKALSFVYGEERSAGLGGSANIPKWLAGLREFFRHDIVALVQKDAIERKGLTQLLFEPETLPYLEKNVDLVTTLMSARGLIPDKAKDIARQIVREVVEELRKKLEVGSSQRRARCAPSRSHQPGEGPPQSGLAPHDSRQPERLGPRAPAARARACIFGPTSGAITNGMSRSRSINRVRCRGVVYSSVMAAIFASLDVIKTKLLFSTRRSWT